MYVCMHVCVCACFLVCIKHSRTKDILSKEKQKSETNMNINVYIDIYSCIHTHTHTHTYYIYAGCAGSSLLYTDFSCSKQGLHSRHDPWTSHCSDFFCRRAQVLKHKFSSFSEQVQLPSGMWDLSTSVTKPISPALADTFLPTGPQESLKCRLFNII